MYTYVCISCICSYIIYVYIYIYIYIYIICTQRVLGFRLLGLRVSPLDSNYPPPSETDPNL